MTDTIKVWRELLGALLVAFAITSCSNKDIITDNEGVNTWVLANMEYYYYWADKLPAKPDKSLAPDSFFKSIIYAWDASSNPNGDQFSWIQKSADELAASLSGESKTMGMQYRFFQIPQSNDVFVVVTYVLPGSPSAVAGLKRGTYITKVNGQQLTLSNYSASLRGNDAKVITTATYVNGVLTPQSQSVTVSPVTMQEDPVYFDTLLVVGTKKIGYIVYNQFIPTPYGTKDGQYDKKLDAVFARFKAAGANELVLDLRYNPGGYMSSAVNLASLIGKGVGSSKVFAKKEFNAKLTAAYKKDKGDPFEEKFVNKTENIGANIDRVYLLVTRSTASAGEMMINSLKPFMPVVLIGGTTRGKNVGSYTLTDSKKRIRWGIQPIVLKYFNSLGQSDFSSGFVPDYPAAEGSSLYPFGDVRDPLLAKAVAAITGSSTARLAVPETRINAIELESSVDSKPGAGSVYEGVLEINQ